MATTTWTLQRTVAPTFWPVTIENVKAHIRLDPQDTSHDALLGQQISAATEQLENDTDRVWAEATYLLSLNAFPYRTSAIAIPLQPVVSIESVAYVDEAGDLITMPDTDYSLDLGRRQIYPVAGTEWPAAYKVQNAVEITFVAGYGDSLPGVPRLAQEAILLQVGKWFRDPAMEVGNQTDEAYERIVRRLVRTSYP